MRRWLILDCPYLCHRALWTTGRASLSSGSDGQPTGITFGFLSSVLFLQERFDAEGVVFCWDRGQSIRATEYPEYKKGRHKLPKSATQDKIDEVKRTARIFRKETHWLRTDILPNIGYSNIFDKARLEADDWMAKTAEMIGRNEEAIIVTADHDLYQCIRPNISMYSPNKNQLITYDSFVRTYRISPEEWWKVKAIAGCPGDNIAGVKGVGERTALKYLTHQLPRGALLEKIRKANDIVERNKRLVKLPWPHTPTVVLVDDKTTKAKWNRVVDGLKMITLHNQGPYWKRRRSKA